MIVRHTPILPTDARDRAAVNQVLSDLSDASDDIDAVNFAEEGMDGRALELHPVGERTGKLAVEVRNAATLPTSASMTQLVHNGTGLRLSSPGSIPATLLANEHLRVRARVWFETTLAAGYGIDGELELQLTWNNGAATAKVPYSGRRAHNVNWHGTVFCEGYIEGPTDLNWVEVTYTLRATGGGVGGVAFPSCSCIWATQFNRVTGF